MEGEGVRGRGGRVIGRRGSRGGRDGRMEREGGREGGREGREWEMNERGRVVGRRTDGPIGRRASIMGA